MMRYSSVVFPVFMAWLSLAPIVFSASDSGFVHQRPMYFTENRGQWDVDIRYAMLGSRCAAWLREDGIVVTQPSKLTTLAHEHPRADESGTLFDVVTLRFRNPSPRMRLRVLDSVVAVSNFYRGGPRPLAVERAANYRRARYENVWDGVSIEYAMSEEGLLVQRVYIARGAVFDPSDIVVAGPDDLTLVGEYQSAIHSFAEEELETRGSAAECRDTLYLRMEFNTAFRFNELFPGGMAVSRNGVVTITGETSDPRLPLRNAVQNVLRGGSDWMLLRFDSSGQDVIYCTYLGGEGVEVRPGGWNPSSFIEVNTDDHVFGYFEGSRDLPLLPNSYQSFPEYSYPGDHILEQHVASYVYRLDASGRLVGASYLGGPGILNLQTMRLANNSVFLIGANPRGHLRVTDGSLMTEKHRANAKARVMLRMSMNLDNMIYMTYLYRNTNLRDDTDAAAWLKPASATFDVAHDGSAVIAANIFRFTEYDSLVLPGIGTKALSDLLGIWLLRIDEHGRQALFSRIIDSDDIPGYFHHSFRDGILERMFIDRNNHIQLFGTSRSHGSATADIPANWADYSIFASQLPPGFPPHNQMARWGMQLSPEGRFLRGAYYGSLRYVNHWSAVERNNTCSGYTFLWGRIEQQWGWDSVDEVNAPCVSPAVRTGYYLVDLNEDLSVRYATRINPSYLPSSGPQSVRGWYSIDAHGYCYWFGRQPNNSIGQFWNSWRLPQAKDSENYLVRFRIYTPCWQVGCGIGSIDTLRIERRRLYLEPEEFEVNFAVTNRSAEKGARILHALIEVPPGFELVNGAPTQAMSPVDLSSGMTAHCSWTLRVTDQSLIADTAVLRCRVFYVDPESGQTYPPGEELCEHDIMVVRYDEADPNLVCTLDGPDTLFWTGEGYAATPDGPEAPIRYIAAFTNLDKDTVHIESFRIAAVEHCTIAGGAVRPGVTLAPGQSHVLTIDVTPLRLRHARTIRVSIEALDRFGLDISRCATETSLPTVTDLPCTASGPVRILWNVAASASTPPAPRYTLELSNPLDTARHDIRAWLDLSSSRHLAPAPGDSLTRDPFFINPKFRRSLSWRMLLAHPPEADVHDTLYFMYESDGLQRRCMLIVEILIIDESVLCSLHGPTEMSEVEVLNREQADLYYTLSNIGTVPMNVDRIDLVVSPDAGVTALDPLSQPGGTLAANSDMDRQWRLRALALRDERTARFDATAYDEKDVSLSVCTHNLHIPGIDGLLCDIAAPDSVRFIRNELRYDPDPVPVTMELRNILDSDETLIEAEIDLTAAPRFELAAGETALKTLPAIPAGETAQLHWLLLPLADIDTETQDIRIRYRSAEQGGWKECMANIVIEGWPRVAVVRCTVSGHDSLHVDPAYERLIPEPFEVSYSVTNTGTVTLHNCEASIVLPQEFELDRGDIAQSYGDIAPGNSVTRWWTLRTTPALSGFGAYQITWTWRSDEQGSGEGCEHSVYIVPEASSGIVFTPLHLHFEAKHSDPLPPAQYVDLWTGGGLSMPWTAQGGDWWLASDPASGDRAARLAVQPVSTALPIGWHATALTIAGQAPNLPRDIAVTYEIHGILSVQTPGGRLQPGEHLPPGGRLPPGERLQPGGRLPPGGRLLKLGEIWPQPVPLNGEARVSVHIPPGEYARITLHDALGREVAVLYDGMMLEADAVLRVTPSALRLQPGMYFIRMIVAGSQVVRGVVVR
jgi:hypothetical protein